MTACPLRLAPLLLLAGSLAVSIAAPVAAAPAIAPAGAGQPALAVGFASDGSLYAKNCAATPCGIDGGDRIETPPGAKSRIAGSQLAVVGIGKGRRAIVVTIPAGGGRPSWQAVVVARRGQAHPAVLFSGTTGYVHGPDGERRGGMVVISEPQADGGRRILIGEQREDVTLCGRPAILTPRVLDPSDLQLHPAKVQRLSVEDRAGARDVVAERVVEPVASSGTPLAAHASAQAPQAPATHGSSAQAPQAPTTQSSAQGSTQARAPQGSAGSPPPMNLLRAVIATSAVGNPAALTDGNPETTWAEDRGGDGMGEFVLMNVPPQVPLSSLDFVVRPPAGGRAHGVAPRELYLASRSSVVHVTFPEDAWRNPGAHYRVALDPPLVTDCLAVVVQSAFHASRDSEVTLAEVSAGSALESASTEKLIAALGSDDARADAAAAILARRGKPAFQALDAAFRRLDLQGRRAALDVLDQAPCAQGVPVYVRALLDRHSDLVRHAKRRLPRCASEAGAALANALHGASGVRAGRLAAMLADVDPALAVKAVVPLLADPSKPVERRRLRVALARAVRSKPGNAAVRARLADASVPETATLDVLRSLGDRVARFAPESVTAFKRLARRDATFRTRYLLLEVAGGLSQRDATARSYLQSAMTRDPDAHVRAQAVRVAADVRIFGKALLAATGDSDVRVRHAAVHVLRTPAARFAAPAIAKRLSDDPWPMVRAEAARSLGTVGPDPAVDEALDDALDDDSPSVVVPALLALGQRGAVAQADDIVDLLDDDDSPALVRAAAASALGLMCHTPSVDRLTGYAQRLKDPMLDAEDRVIGAAALGALGRLHPPDLAKRLAPLRSPKAPRAVRDAADSAFRQPAACSSRSNPPRS